MSDKNDVKIDISGDVSGFSGATAEAEQELNRLKDAAQKTGSSLSDLAKNALPKVAEEVAAVSGVSSDLVMGVAALGAGFVAASLAGVALYQAMSQGREEMLAMNRAIAVSGGYAGQTQQDMLDLSRSVAEVGTVTVAQSKAVVTALVSSGRISSESIGEIARLAEDYAAVTGKNVDSIGADLVKLFADPAKGAAQLNEQMHFLTAAQLEHIESLQEMGRKGEAQLELSNRLKDALPEYARELTTLGLVWNGVQKSASSAWDKMLGVGREDTLGDKLKEAQEKAKDSWDWWKKIHDVDGQVAVYQAAVDEQNKNKKAKEAAAVAQENETKARGIIGQYSDSVKRSAVQQKIDDVNSYGPAGVEKIEALKKLQAEYDKIGAEKSPKKVADKISDYDRLIKTVREKIAVSALDAETDERLTESQKLKAKAISDLENGYSKMTSKQRESAMSLLDEAIANEKLARSQDAQRKGDLQISQYDREDKLALERVKRQSELAQMSERERVAKQAEYQAEDVYSQRHASIIKDYKDEIEVKNQLLQQLDEMAAKRKRDAVDGAVASYDQQRTFEFGWSRSFKKYQDDASNAAKTGEMVFTSATEAMADAGTKLAMRQKVNFNDIANSFVAMIIRMQMQQAAAAVVSGGGGFLGNLFGIISGSIGGAGSSIYNGSVQGNSDYVYDLHGGGLAGFGGSSNNLRDMSMFNSAPRFHSGSGGPIGLRSDEVPAVLLKGERVLNRQETADYGKGSSPIPIRIELINNGTPQKVDSAQPSIDVNGMVIRLITSDINSQGPISKTMETRFGLNRAAGSYA